MNVLIADSSAQITKRLKDIIASTNDTAIIYSADNYDTALPIFKNNKPAVVLLGMNLSGNGSIELLQAIKATGHKTFAIILSIYISDAIVKQCTMLGANFF